MPESPSRRFRTNLRDATKVREELIKHKKATSHSASQAIKICFTNPQSQITFQIKFVKRNREKFSAYIITASFILLVPFNGKAQDINVSLGDNVPRNLNGPAGGAGRVWNTWEPLDEILRDIEGNTTSVQVITDGSGPYGDWWSDLRLLTAGFASPLGEDKKTVSIVGLKPDSAYDLYVASAWGQRSSSTRFTMVNGTSSPDLQPTDNRITPNGSSWVQGQNYVLFQDVVTAPDGSIELGYEGYNDDGVINGLQIVEVSQVAESYARWASHPDRGFTPTVNDGHSQDPDGDGITNLLEFVTNGDPMVASQENRPEIFSQGGDWFFKYDRRDASRYPYTEQIVEYSIDLETWVSIEVPAMRYRSPTTAGLIRFK